MKNYSAKDAEMIIAISTIVRSAQEHKDELVAKRQSFEDPYFQNFSDEIEEVTQKWLGFNSVVELRRSTTVVRSVQASAKKDLQLFKIQLSGDFKKNPERRDELLNTLGFTEFGKSLRNGDQEGVIDLLYHFKTYMTPAIEDEIVDAGTDRTLIGQIKGYADVLKKANINQEHFKSNRPANTAEAVKAFNGIYDKGILIGKLGYSIFSDQPEKRCQYNFRKIVEALNFKKSAALPIQPPPQS